MAIDRIFVVDCETTGLRNETEPFNTFISGPQILTLGGLVVETKDFEPIETFQTKVRFMGTHKGVSYGPYPDLEWSEEAEAIHGISLHDTARHKTVEEAGHDLASFLRANIRTGDRTRVTLAAHNPDIEKYHIRQLLWMARINDIHINHRALDSFTMGFMMWNCQNSNELFKRVSGAVRGKHDAMDDAEYCYQALSDAFFELKALRTRR